MTPDEQEKAMERAFHAWLDDKFLTFGRWTFWGFMTALFAAGVYFILSMSGWHFTDQLGVQR